MCSILILSTLRPLSLDNIPDDGTTTDQSPAFTISENGEGLLQLATQLGGKFAELATQKRANEVRIGVVQKEMYRHAPYLVKMGEELTKVEDRGREIRGLADDYVWRNTE